MKGLGHWYVEIEMQAYWRGLDHSWVNRYVLSGADPNPSDAATVMAGLKNMSDYTQPTQTAGTGVGFVEARAYGAAGGPPFASIPYNLSKGAGTATGFHGPAYTGASVRWSDTLEQCVLLETPLVGLSSTGKPKYLRKYFRGIGFGSDEDQAPTQIPSTDRTQIALTWAPLQTGIAGTAYVAIGTSGALASGAPTVHPYLVNHQIPRGKKKKKIVLTTAQVQAALTP